ncbi:hypothetical protein [Chryseobacterium sp. JK1]|uniref:hypothetical protein n=1 Tax=Chryseobacterium sp. JK1 TaxID=874294 RepID=UPI003D68BB97
MISTVVVKYKLNDVANFESTGWLKKLKEVTEQEEGFIDMLQLPPILEEEHLTIVLCFMTLRDAKNWLESEKRKKLLEEALGDISNRLEQVIQNPFGFQLNSVKKKSRIRQVIVSFIAVYPLTVIIPKQVTTLFIKLEFDSVILKGILVALIISSLMVYLVMPIVLKVFKKWIE